MKRRRSRTKWMSVTTMARHALKRVYRRVDTYYAEPTLDHLLLMWQAVRTNNRLAS